MRCYAAVGVLSFRGNLYIHTGEMCTFFLDYGNKSAGNLRGKLIVTARIEAVLYHRVVNRGYVSLLPESIIGKTVLFHQSVEAVLYIGIIVKVEEGFTFKVGNLIIPVL